MHWSVKYLGIPYVNGACGFDGSDCWGLVRLVLREETCIVLPEVNVASDINNSPAIRECLEEWKNVTDYKVYDCITMRNALGHHIGIVVKVDGESVYVLHCYEPQSSIVQLSDLPRLGFRDLRIWRHE